LRSFGYVAKGADAVIQAFLDQQCTVMAPTFSHDHFAIDPPADLRPLCNGCGDYSWLKSSSRAQHTDVYDSGSNQIDRDMGTIPAALLQRVGRRRGEHPLNSFAAIGPLAEELIGGQQPLHVYAPLQALAALDGAVVLMGVGLEQATLLHLAEQHAGRSLFRRWAKNALGATIQVEVGGCSDGFVQLQQAVSSLLKEKVVGSSLWQMFQANALLEIAAYSIAQEPTITHCGDAACDRCNDAVAGGPVF
jgi:aminoglycoside 3-N-acetyltransferase